MKKFEVKAVKNTRFHGTLERTLRAETTNVNAAYNLFLLKFRDWTFSLSKIKEVDDFIYKAVT